MNQAEKLYELELKRKEFKLFQDLVYRYAGIHLPDTKHALVKNRLLKRLKALKIFSYMDYYDHICRPDCTEELQHCMNAITTNETFFFRHKRNWDFFMQIMIPEWKKSHRPSERLRVWSAAASTGEEAYSAAILLKNCFPDNTMGKVVIDASDINEEVLEDARKASYNSYALQKATPLCVKKYFSYDQAHDRYYVSHEVKSLVNFRYHNLMTPVIGKRYDLIFLRNVMIYFDDKSKAKVLSHIYKALEPDGYLILGGAETLGGMSDKFAYIEPAIYRKKR